MTIEVIALALGALQTNCYIVGDVVSKTAAVIDPADDAPAIIAAVEENGWTVREILATHAHFDHIMAAQALSTMTGAPFRLHEADQTVLQGMQLSARMFGITAPPPPTVSGFVTDGQALTIAEGFTLDVRHTPGHSPGHVSYILPAEQIVFCGDCLFAGSIGRTDLPGGDHKQLMQSITDQLLSLGDSFTVAPGHGPLTTIEQERATNPFLTV